MKYLGIDYGAKRIGIAVSNDEGTIAFPRIVIPNDDEALEHLKTLAEKEHVKAFVIGDTRAVSGAENPITAEADAFADLLAEKAGVEVKRMWEAWSSQEARRFSESDTKDDSAAAAIILQRFLDMRKS